MKLHAYKRVKVSNLKPTEGNPRTHSPEQIAQLQRSIKEFGFTNPLLIDEHNTVLAGHGRLMAAIAEGMEELPVIEVASLTDEQKQALLLADNQLAVNAGWDNDLLRSVLANLDAASFNLSVIGFSEEELQMILAPIFQGGNTDPEDIPETPEQPISQLGDIWELGAHRLCCGDSTNAENVAALLSGVQPHLMVTDPPYGVEYDADWRNHACKSDGKVIGAGAIGKVQNDDRADWFEAWTLFPGEVAYVWHSGIKSIIVAESLIKSGFTLRSQIIWNKGHIFIGRSHYNWQHEPCWYAVKEGKTGHWEGDRKQSTVWDIPKPQKSETGHSTQKPVECMKRPIMNNSSPGQAVYDPFVGSGTTIIAAEMTGRIAYAMEIHAPYVDVAIERWQKFTNKKAILNGSPFDQVKEERSALSQAQAIA